VCLTSRTTNNPACRDAHFRSILEPFVDAQAKGRRIGHLRLPVAPKQFARNAVKQTRLTCGTRRVLGIDGQMLVIQVSRKPREKLSKTGFMMYSKNVRSPVLM
jgi:hypothetical protein